MTGTLRRMLAAAGAVLFWPALALAQGGQVVEYYHTDALGSVRAVTKVVNGQVQVVSRHDYMPFGEEVNPPPPPSDKRLFTGKERDGETGLDYFGARYHRAEIGRFTTVDPGNASASVDDPQSWNTYAYARNNPLRNVDPDGRRWFTRNGDAVWVEPDKDGTYTSPGEGWAAVGPTSEYNGRLNVAFVNGNLSYIGETDKGGKIITPFFREEPLQDTTFSLLSNVVGLASLGRSVGTGVVRAMVGEGGGKLAGAAASQAVQVTFKHGVRHLAGTPLSEAAVESAIAADVGRIAHSASLTGNFYAKVTVGGYTILYRAYTLGAGVINVGTYYVVPR